MSQPEPFNVFEFQARLLPVLLGWAAGSIVTGVVWALGQSSRLRGMGSQFALWGVIDGIIGVAGLLGARRNAERYASGELTRAEHDRHADRFEQIVWVNTALDVGYVLGGLRLARRGGDEFRRGTGWGIVVQGAYLFVWDVILAVLLRTRRAA